MAYRRSTFLINRKFQFRFAFYVCSWLIALSFVYPLIIFQLFDFFFRYLAADPSAPDVSTLLRTRESLLWFLVAMQVILLSVTFLISLFMSHRIAGPLYKLMNFFKGAQSGRIADKLVFRKNDHFQDIAASYNEMMNGLRSIMSKNIEQIAGANSQIERALSGATGQTKADLESALATLRKVQQNIPQ